MKVLSYLSNIVFNKVGICTNIIIYYICSLLYNDLLLCDKNLLPFIKLLQHFA